MRHSAGLAVRVAESAALMLAVCLPAAADTQDYGRPGVYLQIGGLAGIPTFQDTLDRELDAVLGPVDTEVGAGGGVSLGLGYRAHPYFASEVHFEYVGGGDLQVNRIKLAEFSTWMISGNLKAYAARGRIQPYALFGVGLYSGRLEDSVGAGVQVSDEDLGLRMGGGFDAYITPQAALDFEVTWVVGRGALVDLDYVAIGAGVVFRF